VQVRDRLGQWLQDEQFAAAFGDRGRPGWSPSRLALVTILQREENLADRAAAEAVRTRIDWQYLLGLPLDDPGFDHTVLSEFRNKVADAGLEQAALDALLKRLAAGGPVKADGKQRTDSTHVVAAVAALNRLELAGGKRARGAGSAHGRAPGLGGPADLRARFRPPLRHPDDLLAAPGVQGEAGRAGHRLRPRRVRPAGGGL
jgi:transposase